MERKIIAWAGNVNQVKIRNNIYPAKYIKNTMPDHNVRNYFFREMLSSSSCCGEMAAGESIMISRPELFFGKAI